MQVLADAMTDLNKGGYPHHKVNFLIRSIFDICLSFVDGEHKPVVRQKCL